jgi:STE24 endopeptidase
MSRFLLMLVFVAWMSFSATAPAIDHAALIGSAKFLAGYAVLVGGTAVWSRWLARRVDNENFSANLKHFNRAISFARLAVVAWFFVGVFLLRWGVLVDAALIHLRIRPDRFDSPGLLLGCLPAFVAWMGLWWSQYPADVCFREQGMLAQLDAGLPIHQPPTLRSYLRVNLRLQLLFIVVPVLVLVALHDLLSLALSPLGLREQDSLTIQLCVSIATAAMVMIFAPELLRRILQTEPMPPGPLRQRLESVCRRHRIGYKDVLLWRTDYNMGNAAVMGIIPHTRYILMSDLLLETMTDEQIEAVFAHEVGHIIHRHMLWFAVFFGAVMFGMVGLSGPLGDWLDRWTPQAQWASAAEVMCGAVACLSLFLYLSRKFERQADVFAARTIQKEFADGGEHVGPHGATIFSSALHQVARVNCIPITAWSWCHGSIANRIDYLNGLSEDPGRTAAFDRFMARLYAGLIVTLGALGVWAMITLAGQH